MDEKTLSPGRRGVVRAPEGRRRHGEQQQRSSRRGGAVYGLGLIGALVWNWQQAETFWGYPWGVLESFVWPGFLVYELFQLTG